MNLQIETPSDTNSDIHRELLELANQVSQSFNLEADDGKDAKKVVEETPLYQSFKDITHNKLVENNEQDLDDASDLFYTNVEENFLEENDDEYKLPEVDWVNLEAKLKEAQLEINNQVSLFLA